jgi:hypothetical protein
LEKNVSQSALLAYSILSWIFAACVTAQFVLAGLATFSDPAYWRSHVQFVHMFEILPLLAVIIAWIGNIRGGLRWWPVGLLILMVLQYVTGDMVLGPVVAALHPAIAALLFLIAVHVAAKATDKFRRARRHGPGGDHAG